jgi:hypothetical protein
MEGEEGWVGGLSLTEPGDEVETRGGERHDTGVLGRVATQRASATVFACPGLYSTAKSKPRSFPTQ